MLPVLFVHRCWRRLVTSLAGRMPIESPFLCMAFSLLLLATASILLPRATRVARAAPLVSQALDALPGGWTVLGLFGWAASAAAWYGTGVFQARCLQLCFPEYFDGAKGMAPRPGWLGSRGGIALAGMRVAEEDLRTSILVTGVTGSAKTAGVMLPAFAQLLRWHNRETSDELSREPRQKLGAFIPEVKGDLVDACIYLAHEAGRCVSRDVLVLTPSSRVPVVRYRDESGRPWHLCGRGGSGGSDAGDLLAGLTFPAGHPRAGRRIPGEIFEAEDQAETAWPEISRNDISLAGRHPRFIGWRWRGGRLLRVSHTTERDRPALLLGTDGAERWVDPPRRLRAEALLHVDNGLHYNLVDARLPAAEAAERLAHLAEMARGGAGHGENDYFYDQARKLIGACIALHRAVDTVPCTAADIVRLAARDRIRQAALAALEARIEETEDASGAASDPERIRRLTGPWRELVAYFHEEWDRMVADGKTANVIKSILSSSFDPFLRDPDLAETFCRPSTFSFEDVVQRGAIVALVPGDRYAQLGRLLGTACKLDFQSVLLARSSRPDLNAARLIVYFADECHKYVTGGSSTAGDPYFMNLSRSNNVANICATQSYAWIVEVLGREAANVYLSAFGVQFWLQQTDPETCRRAAEICGSVVREAVSADHNFDLPGVCRAVSRGGELAVRRRVREEQRERHRPEDFAHLDVGEVISYNKGRAKKDGKVAKGRARFPFCTRRPQGTAAVQGRVREYYREVVENLTHERGESGRWDS